MRRSVAVDEFFRDPEESTRHLNVAAIGPLFLQKELGAVVVDFDGYSEALDVGNVLFGALTVDEQPVENGCHTGSLALQLLHRALGVAPMGDRERRGGRFPLRRSMAA